MILDSRRHSMASMLFPKVSAHLLLLLTAGWPTRLSATSRRETSQNNFMWRMSHPELHYVHAAAIQSFKWWIDRQRLF
jgi:uncharacterized membrane protein